MGIKECGEILLIEDRGRVIMTNASMEAPREAQLTFAGEAERLGRKDERDVSNLMETLYQERLDD